MTLTPKELDALESLAQAATEGPWETESVGGGEYMPHYGVKSKAKGWSVVYARSDWEGYGNGSTKRDADFIAACRDGVPELIAYARDLEARLEAGRAKVDELMSEYNYGELHYSDLEDLRDALTATEVPE